MNRIIKLIWLFCIISNTALSQTISPTTDNEYCPNEIITFTVTISGASPKIESYTNTPELVQSPYDISVSNGTTTFKFKGRFRDVNIKQVFRLKYYNSSGQ